MTFDFIHIAIIGVSYLLILFGIAYITDKGWMPDAITNHPITYILSMGIFASAWAYYGLVDLAGEFGYGALAYYLGTGAFFLFSPAIQAPLAKLARRYQL
ncbi:histidine kinase, partial [bacterium]|nr:histidine kinase [bacterium]